jgi:hypothetical protein
VLGATLDFIKVAGVLERLRLAHDGSLPMIRPIAW